MGGATNNPEFRIRVTSVARLKRGCVALALIAIWQSAFGCSLFAPAADAGDRSEGPTTRYVLLRNDHVLRGEVTATGASVIVRRGSGSELTLRSDQVFAIRDNLQSLFEARQSMKRRRWQPDIGELLDDARWCVDQQMPDQATKLLLQVYRFVPDHPVASQLESRLRRTLQSTEPEDSSDRIRRASFDRQFDDERVPTSGRNLNSLNGATAPTELHSFTSRIQPILISRCGQCHRENLSRSWQLRMPHSGTRVGQAGTIHNLTTTLRFCRAGDPDASELMRMAKMAHGDDMTTPPIAEHESHLIATISDWIVRLAHEQAEQAEVESSHQEPRLGEDPRFGDAFDDAPVQSELIRAEPIEVQASLTPPPSVGTSREEPSRPDSQRPARLPVVDNPDDVRHFNRETQIRRLFGF